MKQSRINLSLKKFVFSNNTEVLKLTTLRYPRCTNRCGDTPVSDEKPAHTPFYMCPGLGSEKCDYGHTKQKLICFSTAP